MKLQSRIGRPPSPSKKEIVTTLVINLLTMYDVFKIIYLLSLFEYLNTIIEFFSDP